jgi:hypothetical protein
MTPPEEFEELVKLVADRPIFVKRTLKGYSLRLMLYNGTFAGAVKFLKARETKPQPPPRGGGSEDHDIPLPSTFLVQRGPGTSPHTEPEPPALFECGAGIFERVSRAH